MFKALRGANIKLNPEKFTFGVEGGKFLGFMLTHRGIEANPDKFQAILSMRSTKNIKEVQQLLRCLTALSRFVLRLAEKTSDGPAASEGRQVQLGQQMRRDLQAFQGIPDIPIRHPEAET